MAPFLSKSTAPKSPMRLYFEAENALNDRLAGCDTGTVGKRSLDDLIADYNRLFTTAEDTALACAPHLLSLFDETQKVTLSVLEEFRSCARSWGAYLAANGERIKGPRVFEENQFRGFRRRVADCSAGQIGRVLRVARLVADERDFSDRDCRFGVVEPLLQWLMKKNDIIQENPSSPEAVEGKKILFFLFDLVRKRPLLFDTDRPYRPFSPVERPLAERVESRLGPKAAAFLRVRSPRRLVVFASNMI